MPKIPQTKHQKVREPNTDLQRRIIKAVEELYPEYDLKEIANLHEPQPGEDDTIWNEISDDLRQELKQIDAHPSSVTRTVQKFMSPQGEGHRTPETGGLDLNIPADAKPEEYIRGLTDGIEIGFGQGVRWAEEQLDLPQGSLSRKRDRGQKGNDELRALINTD